MSKPASYKDKPKQKHCKSKATQPYSETDEYVDHIGVQKLANTVYFSFSLEIAFVYMPSIVWTLPIAIFLASHGNFYCVDGIVVYTLQPHCIVLLKWQQICSMQVNEDIFFMDVPVLWTPSQTKSLNIVTYIFTSMLIKYVSDTHMKPNAHTAVIKESIAAILAS